jgi:hypothetical protein
MNNTFRYNINNSIFNFIQPYQILLIKCSNLIQLNIDKKFKITLNET